MEIEKFKEKVFRCWIDGFLNAEGEYVYKGELIPFKRLLGLGCEYYSCFDGQFLDFASMENGFEVQDSVDGTIYCIAMVDDFRNRRTGMIDDWDFVFVDLQE